MAKYANYTLLCNICDRVVMRTRSARVNRPVRYTKRIGGQERDVYCFLHRPKPSWDARQADHAPTRAAR